jgi:hypothetical protein
VERGRPGTQGASAWFVRLIPFFRHAYIEDFSGLEDSYQFRQENYTEPEMPSG